MKCDVIKDYGTYFYQEFYTDDEPFFIDYIFPNIIEEGFHVGRVVNNNLGKTTLYIKHYDININSIPFTTDKLFSDVNIGDYVLVWIQDEYTSFYLTMNPRVYNDYINIAKILNDDDSLKGLTVDELKSYLKKYDNNVILMNDEYSLRLQEESVHISSPNIDFEFNDGSFNIVDSGGTDLGFEINIMPNLEINTMETRWNTGTLELTANNPMNIIKNRFTGTNGIMIKSMTGDIDISSLVGFINIFNTTGINMMSVAPINIVAGSLLNLTAPFIPSLTIGFGAPLLPSPGGAMAIPFYVNNMANPFKSPLGSFIEESLSGVKKTLKVITYNAT